MSLSVFSKESFDEREFVEEWVRGYAHLFEEERDEIPGVEAVSDLVGMGKVES
jgi:hypothetical protein